MHRTARAALLATLLLPLIPTTAAGAAASRTEVVVLEHAGAGNVPERTVRIVGGRVERRLDLVSGFVARVPRTAVRRLRVTAGVRSVTVDREFELHTAGAETPAADPTASSTLTRAVVGASAAAAQGAGVDVAIVDSGIAPVAALAGARVVDGVDVSADSGEPGREFVDAFGHGTHLAGVVAAVAPKSRLINVKVADHNGETSLVDLLTGLDWIVRRGDRDGVAVRVITLAVGAEATGDHRGDPMAVAVERAWQRGIAVVAAAGNGGAASSSLDSPAYDPYVIAAGASDTNGTADRADDGVAEFSSRGSATRSADVVAPGVGIVSARVPGGLLDQVFPQARIGEAHFRGSGTSQAAAVVAGAAALVLAQRPGLSPDELKALMRVTARPLAGVPADRQGAGVIDVAGAVTAAVPAGARQHFPRAHGHGGWRGGRIGAELAVEHAANRWTANRWTANRWTANRWTANRWTANRWTANRWTANRWTSDTWDASG